MYHFVTAYLSSGTLLRVWTSDTPSIYKGMLQDLMNNHFLASSANDFKDMFFNHTLIDGVFSIPVPR